MKIDVSLIEGFDTMTPEQKVDALQNFEMDPTKAGFRTQADFDRVSSESAERKRKIRELEEKGNPNTDLEKMIQALQESNKKLERDNLISKEAANYISLGYEKDLAQQAAEASADGDRTKLFELQTKFLEAHDKALKAQALKDMKGLQGGNGDPGTDPEKEKILEMAKNFGKTSAEQRKASQDVLSHYMKG